MSNNYTLASIAWRKRKRNHRLLFGQADRTIRLGWRNSFAAFKPGQTFGYERWRANKYGTIEWQIFVLKAGMAGEKIARVPGTHPGAHILLSAHGKPASKHLLGLLDVISVQEKLAEIEEETWLKISTLVRAKVDPETIAKCMAAQ